MITFPFWYLFPPFDPINASFFLLIYFVLLCLVLYVPIVYHQNTQKDSKTTVCRQIRLVSYQ